MPPHANAKTSDPLEAAILNHLRFARRRDADKGGGGLRTTREIADRHEISVARARRVLAGMARKGLTSAWEDHYWSAPGDQ